MSINKTILLSWDGKDYSVGMTMRLVDKIEEGDINLMKMVGQCAAGDVRFSKAAKLITILLNSAGCDATHEEVFQGIFGGEADIDPTQVTNILWEIFATIFPESKKKPKPKAKRKTSTRTRGKASMK